MAPGSTIHAIPDTIFCMVVPCFFVTNFPGSYTDNITSSIFFVGLFTAFCISSLWAAAFYNFCPAITPPKFTASAFRRHPQVKYITVSCFFYQPAPVSHCVNPSVCICASPAYFYFSAEWYFWRCGTCAFIGV